MNSKPIILGIDEDRSRQMPVAQAFNDQGVFYRFITDRRKLLPGIAQLRPDLLLVFGELDSDFVIQVLDTLASDVSHASMPVIVACQDTHDAGFVQGLRTGVVGVLPLPFGPDAGGAGAVDLVGAFVAPRSGQRHRRRRGHGAHPRHHPAHAALRPPHRRAAHPHRRHGPLQPRPPGARVLPGRGEPRRPQGHDHPAPGALDLHRDVRPRRRGHRRRDRGR